MRSIHLLNGMLFPATRAQPSGKQHNHYLQVGAWLLKCLSPYPREVVAVAGVSSVINWAIRCEWTGLT